MLKTIALMAVVALFANVAVMSIYSHYEQEPQLERVVILWCI